MKLYYNRVATLLNIYFKLCRNKEEKLFQQSLLQTYFYIGLPTEFCR